MMTRGDQKLLSEELFSNNPRLSCHPERSRFSGEAKDLSCHRPIASAKRYHPDFHLSQFKTAQIPVPLSMVIDLFAPETN